MPRYIKAAAAAPPPKSAHFSHAVEAGGMLYITGQLPIDPDNPDAPPPAALEEQAELVFRNLILVAEAAGYRLSNTVFSRIYLTQLERDFVAFNSVYHRHFSDMARLPARTTVGVARLGRGALVEIELIISNGA